MTDCPNADLRDLLPDHVHGTLTAETRARVDAHLAECAMCRDELAVVRAVRGARVEPRAPDVARIVAALPRPAARERWSASQVVAIDASRRGAARAVRWRMLAAAVLVVAAGIGVASRFAQRDGRDEPVVAIDPRGGGATETPTETPTAGAASRREARVASVGDAPVATSGAQRSRDAGRTSDAADAVGALGGIASGATEDELEALIGELESLSGIPEAEGAEGDESARPAGVER